MKNKGLYTACVIAIALISISVTASTSFAGDVKRVLILPFNLHSDQKLEYLNAGIEAMFASRLANPGKVEVLKKEALVEAGEKLPAILEQATAVALARRVQADYVVFGSLTIFGDQHSTDAAFIDVALQKPVLTYNRTANSLSSVISHVNELAGQINATVFGRRTAAAPATATTPKTTDGSRLHPEKLLTQGSRADSEGVSSLRASVPMAQLEVSRSQNLPLMIDGFSTGDVDGDGKNEIVFIGDNTVQVYRYEAQRFQKVGMYVKRDATSFLGVDVVDLNRNGKAEIFITHFTAADAPLRSFVLEYNGNSFDIVAEKLNWFFRALTIPGEPEKIIVGQKKGIDDIYHKSGVYEMSWDNGRYQPAGRVGLPRKLNVHGVVYGDVLNDGMRMVVAYSPDDYLRLMDFGGDINWESVEHFGGSHLYFTVQSIFGPRTDDKIWLKQRIFIADLDQNRENEIYVVQNKEAMDRRLSGTRIFQRGNIHCMAWSNIGLIPQWQTQHISGYISDYSIADIDNDGSPDIAASVVHKGSPLAKKRSYFVFWFVQQ